MRVWLGLLLTLSAASVNCVSPTNQSEEATALQFFATEGQFKEPSETVALLAAFQMNTGDAIIVGGSTDPTSGTVYRFSNGTLERETVPEGPALWWVWGNAQGEVWACGDGGRILKRDVQGNWIQEDTPILNDTILYGIWGDGAGEIFAVGGSYRRNGEQNIFLRSSGNGHWQRMPIPTPDEPYTYFKVWGRNPTWIVGDLGHVVIIEDNSAIFTQTSAGEVLFTVHGNKEVVLAVGGQTMGQIYGLHGSDMLREQVPRVASINGIYVRDDGWRIAVGEEGLMLVSSNGSSWETTRIFPQKLEGRTIHSVSSRGHTILVGGDLRRMDKGFIIAVPPIENEDWYRK